MFFKNIEKKSYRVFKGSVKCLKRLGTGLIYNKSREIHSPKQHDQQLYTILDNAVQGMTYCGLFSICRLRLIGLQNNLQLADCRSRYRSFKSEHSCGTCVIVFRLKGTKILKILL